MREINTTFISIHRQCSSVLKLYVPQLRMWRDAVYAPTRSRLRLKTDQGSFKFHDYKRKQIKILNSVVKMFYYSSVSWSWFSEVSALSWSRFNRSWLQHHRVHSQSITSNMKNFTHDPSGKMCLWKRMVTDREGGREMAWRQLCLLERWLLVSQCHQC